MDWRGGEGGGAMDSGDWRSQLLGDCRLRIVNRIMESLKRHLLVSVEEGVEELKKIAVRFEEKMYCAATSQQDYLLKISLKMLTIETKSQNPIQPNLASSAVGPGSQLNSQTQQLPLPLLQQNIQNNTGMQNSASLAPNLPNAADWQEEIYQKIKSMKELYLPELNDVYHKISSKVQQQDSLPQIEKLKMFKMLLERIVHFLRINKQDIQSFHKEKLVAIEKHINFFLSANRPPSSSPLPVQGSMAALPQNNVQHNSLSGVATISNSLINTVQPGSSVDLGQSNSLNSLQQVATGSLQQNPVNSPQQSGTNPVHANLQQNSNALQQSLMLQKQQLRQQYHHRQMQQLMQQHQAKQQQSTLLQMTQLQQMTDANDLKIRQQMGMKTGVLQQQQSVGSHHPQLKSGIHSPQLHQALSTQVTPQIDQQNMLAKAGTPLQSASSPFVVSTPLAPSPMPGDSEKACAGIGSHTTSGNITVASAPAQSLAIGISASPLLAEFTPPLDANVSAAVPGKSSVEQPFERLMKVVKNMSDKALNSSVSDISSIVSMTDRIAGNGSRATVGEDLVAMTKCRRNYFTQDGPTGTKKMKRYTTSNVLSSSNDSFCQLNRSEAPELESKAKRPKLEVNRMH